MRGRGIRTASRSISSRGSNRRCVVPSDHGWRSCSTTCPSAVSRSRSCATVGRNAYRQSRSRRSRWSAWTHTPASRSNPSWRAWQRPGASTRSSPRWSSTGTAPQGRAKLPPPPRLRRGSPERYARRRPARRIGAALPRRADQRPARGSSRSDRGPPGTRRPATTSAAHRSSRVATRLRVWRIACHMPHLPLPRRWLEPARTEETSKRVAAQALVAGQHTPDVTITSSRV